MTATATRDGVTGHPDPSTLRSDTEGAATVGADRAAAPDEDTHGHIANALQMLTMCEEQDVDPFAELAAGRVGKPTPAAEIRWRLEQALAQLKVDAHAARTISRALTLARAQIRQLELAIAAPQPRGITRYLERDGAGTDVESLITILSDGTVRQYYPNREPGARWKDHGAVPTTRAAILAQPAEAGAS